MVQHSLNSHVFCPLQTMQVKQVSHRKKKTSICVCETKGADKMCSNYAADQRLSFRYADSTIHLLISNFQPASVTVQASLCQTWSDTKIVCFLTRRLKCLFW